MRSVRDTLIRSGARLVGLDSVWFCVTICGVLPVGAIAHAEVGLRRGRRDGRPPRK